MCDYSLETYRSRPARAGEQYVTHRFASGSMGFCSPGDPETAVCMAYETPLKLEAIPGELQSTLNMKAEEVVMFVRNEKSLFHDGIRLANGDVVSLQRLVPGIKASIDQVQTLRRVAPLKAETVS